MQVANSVWVNTSGMKRQHPFTKVDRMKGAVFKYIFTLIVLAFFCSLFYIWSRIQVVNIGYEINRGLALKEKLIEENKRLSLEVATLKSPVRLESLAKNQFQMDLPQKSQILNHYEARPAEVIVARPEKMVPTKSILPKVDKKLTVTSALKSKKESQEKGIKKSEDKKSMKVASLTTAATKR